MSDRLFTCLSGTRSRLVPLVLSMAVIGLSGVTLGGCASMFVGAGAGAVVAAAQERGLGGTVVDDRIKAQISYNWLNYDKDVFWSLGLAVYDRRAMLTGVLKTEAERNQAVKLAWQVPGVKEVINDIILDPSGKSGTYASDTWITTQLRSAILFDKDIAGINYSIDTVRGVVYLLGVAQDRAELDRVIDHARNIKYVTKVVNHVLLKDDPRRTADSR